MLSRMDARQHDDLIFIISKAILDARYAPPKRRRSAWGEGFEEDLEQARRVAAAIVEALRLRRFLMWNASSSVRTGSVISRLSTLPNSNMASLP